jgi:hypothetical protein
MKPSIGVLLCFLLAPAASPQTPTPAQGTIHGSVVDVSGTAIAGAQIKLTTGKEGFSDVDGNFSLSGIAPGPFNLEVSADGFASKTLSGTLPPDEGFALPPIVLVIAVFKTDIDVTLTRTELAQEQIEVEEKQRIFGAIPNYFISYDANPIPLTTKQKFELSGKFVLDPTNFVVAGVIAGVQQSQNTFRGYGQGAEGYGKRYAAAYADFMIGTFIGNAALPSLLRQDPRYLYKGTGSKKSRILYALSTAVICKGDNGKWQPNYSNMLGGFASAGISNLYYPAKDRNGIGLTVENTLIGIGGNALGSLFQEFFSKRLTPSANKKATQPKTPIQSPATSP